MGRWVIMGLIGFFVGMIGFLLHDLIEEIAHLKWHLTRQFIDASIVCLGLLLIRPNKKNMCGSGYPTYPNFYP
jgi:hypothetical protein